MHTPIAKITYNEVNQKIEWVSKLFHFILLRVSAPSNMVPALLLTLVNYFVLDLAEESFYLPFPTM